MEKKDYSWNIGSIIYSGVLNIWRVFDLRVGCTRCDDNTIKISRALLVSFSQHYYWFKPAIVEVFLALSFNTVSCLSSNQSNRFERQAHLGISFGSCAMVQSPTQIYSSTFSEPYSIAEDITVDVLVRLYLRSSDDLGEAPGQRRSQNTTFYCRQLFAECKS